MLFEKQKSRVKSKKHKPWTNGNQEVKECIYYTYLGVTIKLNRSFSILISKMKERVHKALFILFLKAKNGTCG